MTERQLGLDDLVAAARRSSPANRIQWRDPIAAHGRAGIDAVAPWLAEPVLAAFAIRVILRAGMEGQRDGATAALRRARRTMSPVLRADVDWALRQLRVSAQPATVAPAPVRVAAARAATLRNHRRPLRRPMRQPDRVVLSMGDPIVGRPSG
ncbi:MAG: hypothetical protein WEG56_15015 [Chloroflexota bacterium]